MDGKRIYGSIGRIAPVYDLISWLIGYHAAVNAFVARIPFPADATIKVLDAGCGTGPYTLAVLKRFPHATVLAFDRDPGLVARLMVRLEHAELKHRTHLFTADLNGSLTEIQHETFDLIITAGVLEYLPLEETVHKLSKFLKPNGYFINSPLKDNFLGRFVAWLYACRSYSPKTNIEAFTDSGLSLKERYIPSALNFKELHIFQKR